MATVSIRVDEKTKKIMEMHDEINWSAVLRKEIDAKLTALEGRAIDREKQDSAFRKIAELRDKFNRNLHGTELIREWRDSRR